MPTRRPTHPLVKTAAALVLVGAAAAGVWAGSFGAAPRPRRPAGRAAAPPAFLPAGDTASATPPEAQRGADLFAGRCARCHTVGGGDRREGPDLAMRAARRDIGWVRAMIARPDSMFRADSVARWVLEVHGMKPDSAGADEADLRALSAYFATFDPER